MYRLDLETLLLVLRTRSGSLDASLPVVPGLKSAGRVIVSLVNGKVASCVIRDQSGNMISGERALQLIGKRVLEWTYQEIQLSPPSLPSPSPSRSVSTEPLQWSPQMSFEDDPSPYAELYYRGASPFSDQAVPRRAPYPASLPHQSLTRIHRSVFLLIDGTRSLATIAQLLHQDTRRIWIIVTELAQYGYIEL